MTIVDCKVKAAEIFVVEALRGWVKIEESLPGDLWLLSSFLECSFPNSISEALQKLQTVEEKLRMMSIREVLESDQWLFRYSVLVLLLIAPPVYISCRFITAPFGKHVRPGWGPTISPPLAWFLMESPAIWLTLLLFPFGRNSSNPLAQILMSPYLLHYTHRTIVYPLRLYLTSDPRKAAAGFPVSVALMAFTFNILNAYLQTRWVSHYADYEGDALFWWRFACGMAVFLAGMAVNVWADKVLLRLKSEGGGYKIPRGGLYEYVSCPNYFGEILEWLGWFLMTWSTAGFAFFLFTCANLMPRAWSHRGWYLEKFGEDYPRKRKAVIPFLY
nr:steroid 5-alpha-reductase DET2 [Ipomoea batatas]